MIIALLILIILVLLFGAAAIRGWITSVIGWAAVALLLLLAIGFVGGRYQRWKEAREHAELVEQTKPLILDSVAAKLGKPNSSLLDIVTYDQNYDVYLCGSVAGTRGFGGPNGRQRFLSDGGNTEIEREGGASQFNERERLHCTLDPDSAMMR